MNAQILLDALVLKIRDVAGDHLDRVVLYGSFPWGGWDPETSDIDVAVLLRDVDRETLRTIEREIDRLGGDGAFGPASDRLAFVVRPAAEFEALRAFEPCMESKALRLGSVLWESPTPAMYPVLPETEARRLVVERGLTVAAAKADYARIGLRRSRRRGKWREIEGIACEHAQMSACFSLRTLAYARGIDPSEKVVRWSVAGLLGLLGIDAPACAAALPDDYCTPGHDRTEEESRRACAAALRIYRQVRYEAGHENVLLPSRKLLEITRKVRELQ